LLFVILSDDLIYGMANTYVLKLPLIANGFGGGKSTLHQGHVSSIHEQAFRAIRDKVNQMLTCTVKPPAFATPACTPLDLLYV
jgi:hypothetical protein